MTFNFSVQINRLKITMEFAHAIQTVTNKVIWFLAYAITAFTIDLNYSFGLQYTLVFNMNACTP